MRPNRGSAFSSPEWLAVWAFWAALTAGQIYAALALDTNMPRHDDWGYVASFLRWGASGWEELLAPINIHVVPFGKLALFLTWKATGVQLTPVAAVATTFLCASCAVVLVLLAPRLPASQSYLHAVIPLVAIGLAPYAVTTWGTGFSITIVSALALLLFATAYSAPSTLCWRRFLIEWLIVALLALQGSLGLILATPFGTALAVRPLLMRTEGTPMLKRLGVVCLLALLAYAVVAVRITYLEVTRRQASDPGFLPSSLGALANTAIQVMASPFGDLAKRLWPVSGLMVCAFYAATLWGAISGLRSGRIGGPQAYACITALGSYTGVALAVALARSWQGGFTSYYMMYVSGALVVAYVIWCHWNGAAAKVVRVLLFAGLCAVSLWTAGENVRRLREYREAEQEALVDIQKGVPAVGLAARNRLGAPEATLEMLRAHGDSPYKSMAGRPEMEKISVPENEWEWRRAKGGTQEKKWSGRWAVVWAYSVRTSAACLRLVY